MHEDKPYTPALRFRFLTPLYDPLLRWGMREPTFKRRLIEEARIAPRFSSKRILTQKSSALMAIQLCWQSRAQKRHSMTIFGTLALYRGKKP